MVVISGSDAWNSGKSECWFIERAGLVDERRRDYPVHSTSLYMFLLAGGHMELELRCDYQSTVVTS